MVRPKVLLEAKSTVNDSLGLKKAWLDKITQEALEKNRTPACLISFAKREHTRSGWQMNPESTPLHAGTCEKARLAAYFASSIATDQASQPCGLQLPH
jgi:hypothetical protein